MSKQYSSAIVQAEVRFVTRPEEDYVIEMIKDLDQPVLGPWDHTEKLTNWIDKVSHKKQKCSSNIKRDFRVQAVLTHTLHKAKYELRSKQLTRMARWQRIKKQLLKDVHYGSCALYHAIEAERQMQETVKENEVPFNWYHELGLDDLDEFLRQISEVKTRDRRSDQCATAHD